MRMRFDRALAAGNQLFVSSIAMFELWYGVFKSGRIHFNSSRVDTFLGGPITTLVFDEDDARAAGSIRATLKTSGSPIGSYGTLLAGQAINRKLTLVTANVAEFSRVRGLAWQDWGKPH